MLSYNYWVLQRLASPEKYKGIELDYTSTEDVCPICQGWKILENGMYCLCSTLQWMDRQEESFKQYEYPLKPAYLKDLGPLTSKTPSRQKIYDAQWLEFAKMLDFIERWMKQPNTWISMFGGNGTGKTHILRSIKTAMPKMAFYVSVADFQSRVFGGLKDGSYEEYVEFVSKVPILLLDDWGLEHQSSMSTDALAAVIDNRYLNSAEFPTVITSNDVGVFNSPDIAIRRIASRIGDRTICRRFMVDGADYRLPDAQRTLNV
jgi:DNA replication protein DnaC